MNNPDQAFWLFTIFVILLSVIGFYSLMVTRNLIRVLIGLEILTKGVTLLFIIVGHVTGQIALAQALVITMIVIEVVIVVVGGGIILSIYRNEESLDVKNIRTLKG
jgi:NADH-quinone oxidoreductase subunit K